MNIEENREKTILAEKQVIGALLIDSDKVEIISDTLMPDMFYNAILGTAYEKIIQTKAEGMKFDVMSLYMDVSNEYPNDKEVVEDVIVECGRITQSTVAIEKNAETIKKCYAERLINTVLSVEQKDMIGAVKNVSDKISTFMNASRGCKSFEEIADEYGNEYFCDKESKLIKTGNKWVDEPLVALEPGDVLTIAARPAVGKSAFCMQLVRGVAKNGWKVGYFNLEMTDKQIFERLVAAESGIGMTRIRKALRFMNDEQERYENALNTIRNEKNVRIITGSTTVEGIRSWIAREHFDAVFIDYLQLIVPSNRYKGNRTNEVGEISRGLKNIATDFNIPVVMLSQLNREVEKRAVKKPNMSDLRESGAIENDSSIIMFLWNEEEEDRSKKGLSIDKNRNGVLAETHLRFDGDRMRFYGEDEIIPAELSDLEIPFDI